MGYPPAVMRRRTVVAVAALIAATLAAQALVSAGTSDRNTPETPPMRKLKYIPSANSIGMENLIFAFQSVPSATSPSVAAS